MERKVAGSEVLTVAGSRCLMEDAGDAGGCLLGASGGSVTAAVVAE